MATSPCLAGLMFLSLHGLVLGVTLADPSKRLALTDKVTSPSDAYKRDCWLNRPVALAQRAPGPGAGCEPDISGKVYKDGFLEVGCLKDYMFSYGDKYGDNKFSYKLEQRANVSIVHYDFHVKKMDQKPMSPDRCFKFCRTVPNMGYFGIVNGRSCYCTPYYKQMESDSSECDSVCEGAPTQFCGGKDKSTIFGMHSCDDTGAELADAGKKAAALKSSLLKEYKTLLKISTDMQDTAAKLQVSFGKVGDSASTNLLQSAKVFAGEALHASEAASKSASKLRTLEAEGKKITDFKKQEELSKAETNIRDISSEVSNGEEQLKNVNKLKELAYPPKVSKDASKQYYPIMYFVDKAQKDTPQTCGGSVIGKPIVGCGSLDGCASACDARPQECVGFSFYAGAKSLCFLFSKFETAFYYTGCDDSKSKTFMLLQSAQKAAPYKVKCMAKFSEFEGMTLKPDPSGKCKKCLKTLTKADRCFTKVA